MPHTIRTERLLMRPVTLRDARSLALAINDYEVTRTTGTLPYPVTANYMRFRIRKWMQAQGGRQFGFLIVCQGEVIGHLGLGHMTDGRWNLGYSVTRRLWGQGLATEAVRALCGFGFRVLGLQAIEADVFTDNTGSVRVLEKTGFRSTGAKPDAWSTTRQDYFPLEGFELTRERLK